MAVVNAPLDNLPPCGLDPRNHRPGIDDEELETILPIFPIALVDSAGECRWTATRLDRCHHLAD